MTKKNARQTPFGKFVRKLRIDRGEHMKDMAPHLGVTPGFLSAVETGRRNAPQGWEDMLIKAYALDSEQAADLNAALAASRSYEVVNIAHLPHGDRYLVVGLAEVFPDLDSEQRDMLERWIHDARN